MCVYVCAYLYVLVYTFEVFCANIFPTVQQIQNCFKAADCVNVASPSGFAYLYDLLF